MDATALLESMGALLPHIAVLVTGLVILVLDLFLTPRSRYLNECIGIVGVLVALLLTGLQSGAPRAAFLNMAVVDGVGAFFNVTFLLIAVLTILLSASYVRREDIEAGEYYALVLFATAGFMFVAAAADLVMIFLGVETLSIAAYILAGLQRQEPRSQEAAFKYFILGAFSSAFFLYGIATIYGAHGHTNLLELGRAVAETGVSPLTFLGMGLLIVGLGFKAAVVPFHMWSPDVYEGAPTAVTAFMTAGPKAAAFAALVRVFSQGLAAPALVQEWVPIFAVLAALTMILGNIVAIVQQNLKRMLAYSSIAHAGYALVALVAQSAAGVSSMLYYLMAYALISIGSFAVLTVVAKPGDERYTFDDYAGLGTTHPWLAVLMTLFMFALAGFPPTAGFAGKFYIFSAAVQSGYYGLALIGVLTSVVSVVYYARVVIMMYMHEPDGALQRPPVAPTTVALLVLTAFGTLYLGVLPGGVLRLAEQSVQFLFQSP
jgi:NADH-quinone oxidoreductase subunit N